VLSVWFPSVACASALALFTVAVHRGLSVVLPLTVLSVASAVVQYRLYPVEPDTEPAYWLVAGVTGFLCLLAVAWGMTVRARRQLVVSLAERARRLETEQELRIGQARLLERERIAREMHDVLAHRLSLLSMHAGALEFRPDAPAEELAEAVSIVRASAHQSLADLREVINVLRDSRLSDEPLPQHTFEDLPALVAEMREVGTRVEFDNQLPGPDEVVEVPPALGRNTYRIVQEGLTNVRKHAPASTVSLSVRAGRPGGVTIEIRNALRDPGTRESDVPGAGAGLIGLGERATLAGGRLEYGRTTSGEFRLWAWLPWPT
jgi:signal transduction histidine kinase